MRPLPATPKPSMLIPGRRRTLALAAVGCTALTACGGSSAPKGPIATRVCQSGAKAMRSLVGPAKIRVADADPTNIECVLSGDGIRLDVVAQASPRAWTQYDTLVVHAAQAFVPGSAKSNLPVDLPGLGFNAAWVAAKSQLLATNGTQSTGGSFLSIMVSGHARTKSGLEVAKRVATATLALAPRGPSPGPAPS